jgi:hypothetical protein
VLLSNISARATADLITKERSSVSMEVPNPADLGSVE